MSSATHNSEITMFQWDKSPNSECIKLHMRRRGPSMRMFDHDKETPLVKRLRADLHSIPGVEEVSSHEKYYMHVTIGKLFSIDDVKEPVEAAVTKYFQAIDNVPA